MQVLTGLILAAFGGYALAFYLGMIEGNFPLLLLLAVVVTGIYWLAERFYFLPARRASAARLAMQEQQRRASLTEQGIPKVDLDTSKAQEQALRQPWWLDWTAGLFPVILVVFILRSFLFEPFKIPTGSMIPTLWVGDLILVNKFHYGLRLPIINTKITEGTAPAKGDVMVFRYPPDPTKDYIKRVVGVPGDEVSYQNKVLKINGQTLSKDTQPEFFDEDSGQYYKQFEELLASHRHRILNDERRPAAVDGPFEFPNKDLCRYNAEGVICKVPPGHYFMMGDNRDNSLDSRYWGFVPDANIVGKASLIWMNFSHFNRIGSFE
jgi:signal peptidase I